MQSTRDGFTINASRIGLRGGLRTYAEAVIECLTRNFDDVDVVLPTRVPVPEGVQAIVLPEWLSSPSRVSRLRPLLWLAYSALLFPGERSRRVLSATHQSLPFRKRQILTVHDLRPYFYPDTWVQKFYFHALLGRALRRCDGVLTVSETSKQGLVSVYGLDQEKIYVVPNCVDLPARVFEGGVATGGEGEPYLLMVGATWKHKNAMEVLEEHQSWTGDFRLEIVSGAGQYCKQLKDRAVSLGIAEKVNFSNDISERELESLYRGCSALIYPSLMEGFGIPPLEAMARKRQVIVSDIPVFRELFGDAPYFVELGNSASWKRAFVELSQCSPESQVRRINEGLTIASRFSRERMDQALTAAVENIWSVARK